jgi:hypothetical protein
MGAFGQPEAPPALVPVLMLDGPKKGKIHVLPQDVAMLHDGEVYTIPRPWDASLPDLAYTRVRQVTYWFSEVVVLGRRFRVGALGDAHGAPSTGRVNDAAWLVLTSELARQAEDLTVKMR